MNEGFLNTEQGRGLVSGEGVRLMCLIKLRDTSRPILMWDVMDFGENWSLNPRMDQDAVRWTP
jgi:hypothetical protein